MCGQKEKCRRNGGSLGKRSGSQKGVEESGELHSPFVEYQIKYALLTRFPLGPPPSQPQKLLMKSLPKRYAHWNLNKHMHIEVTSTVVAASFDTRFRIQWRSYWSAGREMSHSHRYVVTTSSYYYLNCSLLVLTISLTFKYKINR